MLPTTMQQMPTKYQRPQGYVQIKLETYGHDRSEKIKGSSSGIWDAFSLCKTGFKSLGSAE